MAKAAASKKRGLADKVRSKKSSAAPKQNPFEVKINRQKHDVLGKKTAKHDRGMPAASRFKAIKKRKETLLVEYKKRGKVNKFMDRRFGETDPEMTLEDKMLRRFALERQRGHDKSSAFSLNDDEDLTHYGQSLSQVEKFDEPDISDDDENDRGVLDSDLVTEEHFGGFLTKKKSDSDQSQKPWKERMEEIIAKSKKQKYERQSEKDKTAELTEKLDQDWKSLMGEMVSSKRGKDSITPASKADDYDVMVRQLQFDIRGKATDRLKTDEEIAKEERERLEKLEADRLRRMNGITEDEEAGHKMVFRSADDLDDGFELERNVKFEASYKDGKLIRNFDKKVKFDGDNDDDSDDDGDSNDDDDDDDDENDSDDADDDTDDDNADDDDDDDDLESSADEDMLEENILENHPKSILKNKGVKITEKLTDSQLMENRKKKDEMMTKASKELPYTFPAPSTYEELIKLFEDRSDQQQLLLVERVQKLYHPSLAEGNKDKLQVFYSLLLQYFCDLALQDPPHTALMDGLVSHIYTLTQLSPVPAATSWIQLVKQRQLEFSETAARRGGRGYYPSLDMLMISKLLAVLFPTSDFRHPVVTPAMLYMGQILAQCPVLSEKDVASGLFLCGLFLQYVSISKRVVPEAMNFLCGILFLAADKSPSIIETVPPPFKPVGKHIDLLKLSQSCSSCEPSPLQITKVFSSKGQSYLQSDAFKVCAVHQSLLLIQKYTEIYQNLPSFTEMFRPLHHFISKINMKYYPQATKDLYKEVTSAFDLVVRDSKKTSLIRPKNKPKPLQTFEPKFDQVFDVRKKRSGSKEQQEKQRLIHNHKKEMKGAIRNLRQDNQFLAREKLKERMDKDAERKRKVKELYAELAAQEGDYNAMKRLKNKL